MNPTPAPFTVTRDAISPTLTLTLPGRIAASDIPVQWTAVETGSGIRGYDLEVSADGGANWSRLLTATQDTSYTFSGGLGVAYTFRVRATDNVNNVSAWVQAEAKTVVVKKYYTVAGQRIGMRENGVLYYLHTDHLGSTSLTTDESGAAVAEQKYLPYGEVRWVTGTLPTDFGYTGQRAEDFGLYDYRARHYSPHAGRFISPDSIVPGTGGAAQNRYMYVEGNPLKYVDPSGHCAGLSGFAFDICKAVVIDIQTIVNKANEYREVIFFPTEDTTFGERAEASAIVGGGAVVAGVVAAEVAYGTWTTAANTALLNMLFRYPWLAPLFGYPVDAFSTKLASGASSPNLDALSTMKDTNYQELISKYNIDCSEIAEHLQRAAGGEGHIIEIAYSNASPLNPQLRIPEASSQISRFLYHQVYTDGTYVFDPRYSLDPMLIKDYMALIKELNPMLDLVFRVLQE